MTIDYTVPMLSGGGLGPASYPADGGFNLPRQTVQYFGDLEFPRGGGNYPAYQFGYVPGAPNQPAPLTPGGIPMTPSAGATPSQYAAPQSSGPYGLLAQQLAGIQPTQAAPTVPIVPGTPATKPPRGLLQS